MDIEISAIWWSKMRDRDKLRTDKILQRDNKLRALYKNHPKLKAIDKDLSAQVLKISRLVLEKSTKVEDEKQTLEDLRKLQKVYLENHQISPAIYEPDWDCKKCKDLGYIEAGTLCECFKAEAMKEKKIASNIPLALFDKTFDSFDYKYYEDKMDIEAKVSELQCFIKALNKGHATNFILTGDVGRGKTHLALACANLALELGHSVYYATANELIDEIRINKYNDERNFSTKEIYEKYLSPDLLIIDDLGTETPSDFTLTQFTMLIEERNLIGKPWIITLNYPINSLEKRYDSRFVDRLLENTRTFQIKGDESIRLLKRRAQLS